MAITSRISCYSKIMDVMLVEERLGSYNPQLHKDERFHVYLHLFALCVAKLCLKSSTVCAKSKQFDHNQVRISFYIQNVESISGIYYCYIRKMHGG